MTDGLFGPIAFNNGCHWNPTASKDDDPNAVSVHLVQDLVTVIRGTRPNRPLGNADEYIWAGEWDLAAGEIDAVLAKDGLELTEFEAEVLRRAKAWVMSDEEN